MDDLARAIGRLEGLLDPKSSGETIDELVTIRRGLRDEPTSQVRLPNLRLGFECKERWQDMVGDDRVRACGGCHRPVFNLSAMTHDEAEQLLATRGLTPCVRFYRRPDGTVMTTDCPTSGRARRRLAVVASSLAAGAAFASPTTAHAEPGSSANIDATTGESVSIVGVVTDQKSNQPLAGVTVTAAMDGQMLAVITDERGAYRFTGAPAGTYVVTFYYFDLTIEGGDVQVSNDKVAQLSQTVDSGQARGGEVINIEMGLLEPQQSAITIQQDYTMGIPLMRGFGSVLEQPAVPEHSAVEWSLWARLGMGIAERNPTVLARELTPHELPQQGAGFEAALSAELTVGIANDRKIRIGGWGEVRTTSGPVVGGELVVTGLPPHPMASTGSGAFVLRAGGNGHVVTGALGFGYTGAFSREDPWLTWLDHAVGARAVVSINRSLDDPRDWSATLGLEVEPLGLVQAVVRRIDDR